MFASEDSASCGSQSPCTSSSVSPPPPPHPPLPLNLDISIEEDEEAHVTQPQTPERRSLQSHHHTLDKPSQQLIRGHLTSAVNVSLPTGIESQTAFMRGSFHKNPRLPGMHRLTKLNGSSRSSYADSESENDFPDSASCRDLDHSPSASFNRSLTGRQSLTSMRSLPAAAAAAAAAASAGSTGGGEGDGDGASASDASPPLTAVSGGGHAVRYERRRAFIPISTKMASRVISNATGALGSLSHVDCRDFTTGTPVMPKASSNDAATLNRTGDRRPFALGGSAPSLHHRRQQQQQQQLLQQQQQFQHQHQQLLQQQHQPQHEQAHNPGYHQRHHNYQLFQDVKGHAHPNDQQTQQLSEEQKQPHADRSDDHVDGGDAERHAAVVVSTGNANSGDNGGERRAAVFVAGNSIRVAVTPDTLSSAAVAATVTSSTSVPSTALMTTIAATTSATTTIVNRTILDVGGAGSTATATPANSDNRTIVSVNGGVGNSLNSGQLLTFASAAPPEKPAKTVLTCGAGAAAATAEPAVTSGGVTFVTFKPQSAACCGGAGGGRSSICSSDDCCSSSSSSSSSGCCCTSDDCASPHHSDVRRRHQMGAASRGASVIVIDGHSAAGGRRAAHVVVPAAVTILTDAGSSSSGRSSGGGSCDDDDENGGARCGEAVSVSSSSPDLMFKPSMQWLRGRDRPAAGSAAAAAAAAAGAATAGTAACRFSMSSQSSWFSDDELYSASSGVTATTAERADRK